MSTPDEKPRSRMFANKLTAPVTALISQSFSKFNEFKKSFGLTNPGTVDTINKEVSRDVLLTPFFFTGLKADVSKSFSLAPVFQVSHALSIGNPMASPYAFAAAYANQSTMMQGNIESDMSLSGRMQQTWNKANVSRAQFQMSPNQPSAIVQLEHETVGPDFSLTLRALNPSISTGQVTGMYTASILQSVTKYLALGTEGLYTIPPTTGVPADLQLSYFLRYATPLSIFSFQMRATGQTTLSFWRKIADKVEAGLETEIGPNANAMLMGNPNVLDATTTLGAKYEFRQSIFRGQVDSNGKVSFLAERQVLPILALSFAGEIDHFKNTSRVGMGLQLEAGAEEVFDQQQQIMLQQAQQAQQASNVNNAEVV